MTDELQPALTAEQWADAVEDNAWLPENPPRSECYVRMVPENQGLRVGGGDQDGVVDISKSRHGLAALCLHGQPFGFTRRMVRLCEMAAAELGQQQKWQGRKWVCDTDEVSPAEYEQIAHVIAALLPPPPPMETP